MLFRHLAISLLLFLALAGAGLGFAPSESLFELSAKSLAEEPGWIFLPMRWKFHPGDDPAFAATGFDDSSWQEADTRLRAGERPEGWRGLGWFRLRLAVSPGLRGVPLGLSLRQFGAAEVYLDGVPLYTLGTVDARPQAALPRLQRQPHLFSFEDYEEHVLAVRFCNHDADRFESAGKTGGFRVTLGAANREVAVYGENLRTLAAYRALFTGLFAAFALLHLLLYGFYREADENLWFGLLSATVAVLAELFFRGHFTTDPRSFELYDRGANSAWLALSIVALRFVYCVYGRLPKHFYAMLSAALVLAIPGWWAPATAQPWILALLLLAGVEMVRTVIVANFRQRAGARIVGLGILILAAGMAIGLLTNLGVVPPSIVTVFLIPFGSVLALILTMSVYLSRRFAETNRELREQLRQVRELSEHKLEQERRRRADEVERRLLEAENRRQAEELEVARKLQLSMLPTSLPVLPDLEIAAGMFTATEVGGDYYDFEVSGDGTLTVAVGDATGHGMKAGTLVTATKSLFKALDGEAELPEALGRFGRALKRMNLRQLQMALMLARFKAGRLRLAVAGMPPVLIHRAASNRVESVIVAGMPLGSLVEFPYRQSELGLDSGDTVLLMSDGFPERLNHDDEMLGYDKVREAFSRVAATPPQTIIDRLVADGEAWAEGKPAVDDTTFVVLKMR